MWKLLLLILVAVCASSTGRLIHESSSDEADWQDLEDEDEISHHHQKALGFVHLVEQLMREEETAAGKDEFAIENKAGFALWVNADCDRQWLTNRATSDSSSTSANGGFNVLKIGVEAGGSHSSAQSKEEAYEYTQKTSGFTLVPPEDTLPFLLPSCYKGKVYVWIRYQDSSNQWFQPMNGWPTKMGTYTVTVSMGYLRLNQLCAGDDSGCNIDGGLGLGDGDCDHGNDCERGLICGKDNCMSEFDHRGGHWDAEDDCCTTKCWKEYFADRGKKSRADNKYWLNFMCPGEGGSY